MALMVFDLTCIKIVNFCYMFGKSNVITLGLLDYSWVYFDERLCMGQRGHFYSVMGLGI